MYKSRFVYLIICGWTLGFLPPFDVVNVVYKYLLETLVSVFLGVHLDGNIFPKDPSILFSIAVISFYIHFPRHIFLIANSKKFQTCHVSRIEW